MSAHTTAINSMCLPVKVNGVIVEGLLDTGSDICVIKEPTLKLIKPTYTPTNVSLSVSGLGSNVRTKGSCNLKMEISGEEYDEIETHIVEGSCMKPSMILGMNLLRQAVVKIDGGQLVMMKKLNEEEEPQKEKDEATCFLANIEIDSDVDKDIGLPELCNLRNKTVAKDVQKMIKEYSPACPAKSPIQMKIIPLDDIPVFQRPRRFPPKEQKVIDEQVEEWLRNGIIIESSSDYASPVVLVKKKDGSHRLCIDYRALNKKIHRDHYPLPIIEDQIDKLQDSTTFSTIDLENGFFHVEIEPGSRKYTAFVTQRGQFEFLRVPFGLCNSPSVFQRYINHIFRDLINEGIIVVYIDDLVVLAKSVEEGLRNLKRVLQWAAENGLHIKWKKCQFLQSEVEYLGHVVKAGTVSPSPVKTKAVVNFPQPSTIKQVQSFLGLTGYFRKFIADYAVIAKPLSDLLKKDAKFIFGAEAVAAFKQLKLKLTSPPVLSIFKQGRHTELHTDASKFGYGAVLLQKNDEDEKLHPVYYMSRKTNETEQRYTSYELEVLAVIQAVRKFRIYLLGQPFKIITDCKAFTLTLKKK